jgi:hypothetical protein
VAVEAIPTDSPTALTHQYFVLAQHDTTVLEQKYETTPLFAPHPLLYHFSYILLLQLENLTDFDEKWLKMLARHCRFEAY